MIIRTTMRDLLHDQRGATAIEYGLICSLIILMMMAGLQKFANSANDMFGKIETTTSEAMQNS
jgi:pilus assembly protein Flp/PilA